MRIGRLQHGVIGRSQLLRLGLGRRAIEHRLGRRRLLPVHHGVYALGPAPLSRHGEWMAAVLAAGPGALLSHGSAAALWGLERRRPGPVHVTLVGAGGRGRPNLTIHRARHLHPSDRATSNRIPVTAVPLTLLSLAAQRPRRRLHRAAEQADRLGLLNLNEVQALLARSNGRDGAAALRELVADFGVAPATRSELEDRFLDLCREVGVPLPLLNATVAGLEVDAYWPRARLVVELDGYAYHRGRAAFERDHARDATLHAAGVEVLRFTWRQLAADRAAVRALLRSRAA